MAHNSKCYKNVCQFIRLTNYVLVYDSYKHPSKYPFDNYRISVLQWGRGVICLWYRPYSINIDLWLTIVNVIKMFANLQGYVLVYDSYKHHSKYPFDNYRINVLQWGVICLWRSILTRGLLYIDNCKALSIWTPL